MIERTAVYRIRRNSELLYIGASYNPWLRFGAHLAKKDWGHTATHMEIEWFATRDEALTAERLAIAKEQPRANLADYATELSKKAEKSTTKGGRALSAWLAQSGMTQEQLGDALGVHFTAMSRVLTGKRILPKRTIHALEKITGGTVPASIWPYKIKAVETPAFDADLTKLIYAGHSQKDAAEKLNMPYHTVNLACRRLGIKTQKSHSSIYEAELKRMAADGKTKSQAAAELGISQPAVSMVSIKLGIEFRDGRNREKGRGLMDGRVDRLRNLASQGLTVSQAAREMGIAQPYVSQLKKDYGIQFRISKYATPRGATL